MDLYCPTCGEPSDTTHMREDEPHEWGLSALELRDILAAGRFAGDTDRIREAAHAAGWEFATEFGAVVHQVPVLREGDASS